MKTEKIFGRVVSEQEASVAMGFFKVEDFRSWQDAGSPTGRCSNGRCYAPIFWPNLDKPCPKCGSAAKLDAKRKVE